MLLLWLLVVPTVHGGGSIQCQSACGLCAIDKNPATASCKLCRECLKVHRRMTGAINKITPGLYNRQKNQLKNLEMKEFKEVMREYGWEPKDFVDDDNGNNNENKAQDEELGDEEGDLKKRAVKGGTNDITCVEPPPTCINDEEYDQMMNIFPNKKLTYKGPQKCQTASTTTTTTVDPCKNKSRAGKRLKSHQPPRSTVTPLLRHIETLMKNHNKDVEDCPPQRGSSEYEDTDESTTEPATKQPHKQKLMVKITTEAPKSSCMPCMPLCPLPCSMQLPQNSILPSIPQEAIEALMTLRPTKSMNKKLILSPEEKKEELILSEEITSEVPTEATRQHTSSTDYIEDTRKDYVYLYVGVPKEVNIRRG